MDIQAVLDLLPHRYPFLMIDRVEELISGQSVRAIKCVTANEPQFQGHFPGEPIFPGVLLIEAFAQAAGIVALSANPDESGQAVYLMGIDKVRFKHPVRPGDRVVIRCEKIYEKRRIWKFAAVAEVDGRQVAKGEVIATIPDEAMRERARS